MARNFAGQKPSESPPVVTRPPIPPATQDAPEAATKSVPVVMGPPLVPGPFQPGPPLVVVTSRDVGRNSPGAVLTPGRTTPGGGTPSGRSTPGGDSGTSDEDDDEYHPESAGEAESSSSDSDEDGEYEEDDEGNENAGLLKPLTVPIDIDEEPTIKHYLREDDAEEYEHPNVVKVLADSKEPARHTRAQVSLVDTSFGDIEEFLEMPDASDHDAQLRDRLEYDKFLHGLRKDGDEDADSGEEDEEYVEDDENFTGIDEFRGDLACTISKRELEMLLRGANEDVLQAPDPPAASPPKKAIPRPRAAPKVPPQFQRLEGPQVPQFPMSPLQRQQHSTQLHEHLQLLVEVGLMAKTAAATEKDEAEQRELERLARGNWRMIIELHHWHSTACHRRMEEFQKRAQQAWFEQQRQTKISASLIGGRHLRPREGRAEENINAIAQAFVPDIEKIQVPAERLRTAYDVAALPIALNAPVRTAFEETPLRRETRNLAVEAMKPYCNPYLAPITQLTAQYQKLRTTKANSNPEALAPIMLQEQQQEIQKNKRHLQEARVTFTPAEDALLALGIEMYGITDLEGIPKIVQKLLPTKTPTQIKNRWKNDSKQTVNKRNKRKAPSLLKSVAHVSHLPLTVEEQRMLIAGVQIVRCNFKGIAQKFMPYRSQKLLHAAWGELCHFVPSLANGAAEEGRNKRRPTDLADLEVVGGEELPTHETLHKPWHARHFRAVDLANRDDVSWKIPGPRAMEIPESEVVQLRNFRLAGGLATGPDGAPNTAAQGSAPIVDQTAIPPPGPLVPRPRAHIPVPIPPLPEEQPPIPPQPEMPTPAVPSSSKTRGGGRKLPPGARRQVSGVRGVGRRGGRNAGPNDPSDAGQAVAHLSHELQSEVAGLSQLPDFSLEVGSVPLGAGGEHSVVGGIDLGGEGTQTRQFANVTAAQLDFNLSQFGSPARSLAQSRPPAVRRSPRGAGTRRLLPPQPEATGGAGVSSGVGASPFPWGADSVFAQSQSKHRAPTQHTGSPAAASKVLEGLGGGNSLLGPGANTMLGGTHSMLGFTESILDGFATRPPPGGPSTPKKSPTPHDFASPAGFAAMFQRGALDSPAGLSCGPVLELGSGASPSGISSSMQRGVSGDLVPFPVEESLLDAGEVQEQQRPPPGKRIRKSKAGSKVKKRKGGEAGGAGDRAVPGTGELCLDCPDSVLDGLRDSFGAEFGINPAPSLPPLVPVQNLAGQSQPPPQPSQQRGAHGQGRSNQVERSCSYCKAVGHNRRTCPQRKADEQAQLPANNQAKSSPLRSPRPTPSPRASPRPQAAEHFPTARAPTALKGFGISLAGRSPQGSQGSRGVSLGSSRGGSFVPESSEASRNEDSEGSRRSTRSGGPSLDGVDIRDASPTQKRKRDEETRGEAAGEEPEPGRLACEVCGKVYTSRRHLLSHMAKAHPHHEAEDDEEEEDEEEEDEESGMQQDEDDDDDDDEVVEEEAEDEEPIPRARAKRHRHAGGGKADHERSREENAATVLAEGLSRSCHSDPSSQGIDASAFSRDQDRELIAFAKASPPGFLQNVDVRNRVWGTPANLPPQLARFTPAQLEARYEIVMKHLMQQALSTAL